MLSPRLQTGVSTATSDGFLSGGDPVCLGCSFEEDAEGWILAAFRVTPAVGEHPCSAQGMALFMFAVRFL